MTRDRSDRDLDAALGAWMNEVAPTAVPVLVLEEAFAQTMSARQVRVYPWNRLMGRRGRSRSRTAFVLVATAALLIAVVAFGSLGGGVGGAPARSPTSSATRHPSTSPSSSPSASPVANSRFTSARFAVPVSFSLAGGWTVNHDLHSDIDLHRDDHGASAGPFESFTGGKQDAEIMDIGSTTVAGATKSDPNLPWPEDLYAWLQSRPEFKPQPPKAITVGGRPATQIDADVTVPDGTSIALVCSSASNCWLLDHNDRWRFVEVKNSDGSGVVWITNGIPAPGFDAFATALDQLLATFKFR